MAMAFVPAEDRLGGGRDLGVARREPGHHAAQFGKHSAFGQVGMHLLRGVEKTVELFRIEARRHPCRDVEGKERLTAVVAPNQDRRHLVARQHRMIAAQQRQPIAPLARQQRLAAPQHRSLRTASRQRRVERGAVPAQIIRPIKPRAAECHIFRAPHPCLLRPGPLLSPARAGGQAGRSRVHTNPRRSTNSIFAVLCRHLHTIR